MPKSQNTLCAYDKRHARSHVLECIPRTGGAFLSFHQHRSLSENRYPSLIKPGAGTFLKQALVRKLLMFAATACALALAGCSTVLVRPKGYAIAAVEPVLRHAEVNTRRQRALLASQAPPDCEYKGSDADVADKDLWEKLKLDYERHCYQHAEGLVRNRLHQLQVSGLCELRVVRHRSHFLRAAPSF